ncbi:hypothetical protein [uncultured Lacinutrix sp.]|uniref:hypothetical protein n=1 Tax=uncultured Lacinutrix sp. TaxID=574032 RepID=UPI002618E85A|nr:hypothetical protein [uncultured Lacinutrix sp.]
MIRKFLFCLITVALFSCSVDDAGPASHQELLPIESVVIPDEFQVGISYQIDLTYVKPTNCHSFYNIYYLKNFNERTVAVISTVYQNENCTTIDAQTDVSFNFVATQTGSYIFKFWQGEDQNGEDTYLEMEIPAVE